MKKILRKIKLTSWIFTLKDKIYFRKEFINDYHFFKENYIGNKKSLKNIEYDMLLIVHSLEKGMSSQDARVFGKTKINKLINLLNMYKEKTNESSYAYNMAINALYSYKDFFKEHNWQDTEEYKIVDKYLQDKTRNNLKVGFLNLEKKDTITKVSANDYNNLLSTRHAVRKFSRTPLKQTDIETAINLAIKSPSACNRQMIHIYNIENKSKREYIINNSQRLTNVELENVHFFVITFDVSANYFVGERNQGWFNAGLFSMNFVNALHTLGIGSCFLQFGSGFKKEQAFKKILEIPTSERIAVILATGYYADFCIIPYSTRKTLKEIYYLK